jgi:hypothetical protein
MLCQILLPLSGLDVNGTKKYIRIELIAANAVIEEYCLLGCISV